MKITLRVDGRIFPCRLPYEGAQAVAAPEAEPQAEPATDDTAIVIPRAVLELHRFLGERYPWIVLERTSEGRVCAIAPHGHHMAVLKWTSAPLAARLGERLYLDPKACAAVLKLKPKGQPTLLAGLDLDHCGTLVRAVIEVECGLYFLAAVPTALNAAGCEPVGLCVAYVSVLAGYLKACQGRQQHVRLDPVAKGEPLVCRADIDGAELTWVQAPCEL